MSKFTEIECKQHTILSLGKNGQIGSITKTTLIESFDGNLIEVIDDSGSSVLAQGRFVSPNKKFFPLPGSLNVIGKLYVTDEKVDKSNRVSNLTMWDENNGIYILCDRLSTICSFFKLRYEIEVKFDAETGEMKPDLITESEKIG